jgi:hypothetical protein
VRPLVAQLFSLQSEDQVSTVVRLNLVMLFLTLFALVPRLLGVFAMRRTTNRQVIAGALAATKPTSAGGFFTCRQCRAPIEFAQSTTLSKCMYCESENVLDVPSDFLRKTVRVAVGRSATIEQAAALEQTESKVLKNQLIQESLRYLATGLFFAMSLYIMETEPQTVDSLGQYESTPLSVAASIAFALGLVALGLVSFFRSDEEGTARRKIYSTNKLLSGLRFVGPVAVLLLVRFVFL